MNHTKDSRKRVQTNPFFIGVDRRTSALRQAHGRGAPKQLLTVRPYLLQDNIKSLITRLPGKKIIKIASPKQQNDYLGIFRRPFRAPYVYVIGCSQSDNRGRLLALRLMLRANMVQSSPHSKLQKQDVGMMEGKERPLWHTLLGTYKNKLRDNPGKHNPSMLLVSNVTAASTPVKLETLRDLLEIHNDIPRIIVVVGINPLIFATTKLYCSVNYIVNLASDTVLEI